MDYSYFATAQQPYQFMGLPPTPTNSGSANSDEFSNSPPDAFDQFQPSYDFAQFNNTINGLHTPKPPTPISQHNPAISSNTNLGSDMNFDINDEGARRGSNSDDDDNMTPAQSRRKAQNRAAQRAFRERKERHVKDLEAKLALLEQSSATVQEENERLKLQLQKAATENEILKATSAHAQGPEPLPTTGPMRFSPKDYHSEVSGPGESKSLRHRIVTSETGGKLLAAGSAWDFITKHPLYIRGLVDVGIVSDRLKHLAKCDGQGPVFEEKTIIKAIEMSVASGSDELL